MIVLDPEARPTDGMGQDCSTDIAVSAQSTSQRSGGRGHTGHRIGEWHGRAKYSDATVRMARELYAEVCSYESVGYLLGVPARTVADWIRRDTRWGVR